MQHAAFLVIFKECECVRDLLNRIHSEMCRWKKWKEAESSYRQAAWWGVCMQRIGAG